MFKILGVDHIGVAVSDLKETQNFWTTALGLDCTGEEVVAEQKVKTSFNPTGNGSEIELLEATEGTARLPNSSPKTAAAAVSSISLCAWMTLKQQLLTFRKKAFA